jgi:hypothetical protein
MEGVEKGSVKKLMVLESLPKPINFTGGMDKLNEAKRFDMPGFRPRMEYLSEMKPVIACRRWSFCFSGCANPA